MENEKQNNARCQECHNLIKLNEPGLYELIPCECQAKRFQVVGFFSRDELSFLQSCPDRQQKCQDFIKKRGDTQ